MKVYLDNNVVSAIARKDHQSELEAITQLLKAYRDGKITLVTSEIALREIQQYQGEARPKLERVFQDLQKVPIVRYDELAGMNVQNDVYTSTNSPHNPKRRNVRYIAGSRGRAGRCSTSMCSGKAGMRLFPNVRQRHP